MQRFAEQEHKQAQKAEREEQKRKEQEDKEQRRIELLAFKEAKMRAKEEAKAEAAIAERVSRGWWQRLGLQSYPISTNN